MIENDMNAIHAIGNGSFLIYSTGSKLGPIFGPDYTSASFGELCTEITDEVDVSTYRLQGTNCWVHILRHGNKTVKFTDVMDPEYDVFVRKVQADFACTIRFTPSSVVKSYFRPDLSCVLHIVPPGAPCFVTDTTRIERRMAVFTAGCVHQSVDGKEISVTPGEGILTLAVARMPQLDEVLDRARNISNIQIRDSDFWQTFLSHGKSVRDTVPNNSPEYERVQAVLESVPIQIKAQQSRCGGVMAGHYYCMAYVRDQAGVLRGLLRMGYHGEARSILEFWYRKWKRFGNLHNAESMGNEDARLVFSNDEVEVPAYVVLSACEYLDVTGDSEFIFSIFDMLSWAMKVQLKHLAHGMTGFSGDETYIAGRIFPRYFLYHGSSESTLLFIEGTRRALAFEKEHSYLSSSDRQAITMGLDEATRLYKDNFVVDGVLYGNNPVREQYAALPRFHFGYCDVDEIYKRPAPLTWLERGENGLYCCPDCLHEKIVLPIEPDARILLGSINLLPIYYHSMLFSQEELRISASPYLNAFVQSGLVRSELNSDRSLGYDYGLLLYNAAFLDHESTQQALRQTLDMIDSCGMWAEYYIDGVPFNCRCRPWESAINMEAILYALAMEA